MQQAMPSTLMVFPVDIPVADDPSANWGDIKEFRLASALTYVQYGPATANARLRIPEDKWQMIDDFNGLKKGVSRLLISCGRFK